MPFRSLTSKDSIAILTGAGISAESGLATFRGADGLWCGHRVEDVATPEAFARDPALVHEFYNFRRQELQKPEIQPNAAHTALARLEQSWQGSVTLVTQNIDNLHERGGSQNIIHMHGEALRAFCLRCLNKCDMSGDMDAGTPCPSCQHTGGMRPDIVWFGEMPYHMDEIENALSTCDLFVAIGTSGHVYPAAGFVQMADHYGAITVEINLEPSINAHNFSHSYIGPASETVPQFVDDLLKASDLKS